MQRLAWIVILLLWPILAAAESVEVSVSERGRDATEARSAALVAAEQKAFRKLIMERSPDKAEAILGSYEPQHISQMVQGYEVVNETITDNSYHAKLKIEFHDAMISRLLNPQAAETNASQAAADEPSETQAVLVLPVFRDGLGIFLWGEENVWREHLNRAAISMGFDRLVMPYGDPTDRLMIDSGNVTTASYALLSGMARRYGAREILIAVAEPEFGSEPIAVNTTLRVLGPQTMDNHKFRMVGEDLKEALRKSAEAVVTGINGGQESAEGGEAKPPLHELAARVVLSHVRDWVELRGRLEQIEGIEHIDVVRADWKEMMLTLSYRGQPELLGQQLAQANIAVEKGDGFLKLAIR